ncbi:hypothetical protein ALC62_09028 [Cyphomyrmex costatus]|uniref:Gustatory receptor n=1 Tax=Cyphomyrmex costatus TaxID=456900 RepID=A0A151IGN7_9HYME|nr:hypothetical protein ALC62_09028 [Cyphomyrmex costatus]
MTISLQSALAPLFIMSSFYCLVLFEYPLGQPRLFLSCLYALVILSTLIYIDFPMYYIQQETLISILAIIHFLYILIALISIFINLYRNKELKICLHALSTVDDTLEALGSPKEYQVLRNWIFQIIIGWNIYIFIDLVITICNFIYLSSSSEYSYIFKISYKAFILKYFKHVVNLNALIYGTIIGYTSSRFHRANNRLLVIYSDIFENNADYRCRRQNRSILVSQRITGAKNRKQYIWIIM